VRDTRSTCANPRWVSYRLSNNVSATWAHINVLRL
jgi:hypothetical protein